MIYELLIFLIIAIVWQYIAAPPPLKLIGWIIIAIAFLFKFILPMFPA